MKWGPLCHSGDTAEEWGPLCHSGDRVAGQESLLPWQGHSRDVAEGWGSGGQGQQHILVGCSFHVACGIIQALIN